MFWQAGKKISLEMTQLNSFAQAFPVYLIETQVMYEISF